ncbi:MULTISPECIES: hypothetical protein [Campylobacter]|jgi:hypothetical protein|uniref:Uncharacterized protein n=1 Tax=Campylobacter curvus (strain 525.92) TaxID=360105 RepID=A7GZE3_CAMC5|nr:MULTISPECIES: hypothetical protein [Campylobacter]EAU01240.1 hypothetical protein CCV52592_0258 [Campylobacter curvus 525.92]EJP74268.1 hypothetical protein HMPREF1139_1220 [Campylobacter sp. FOBRC14]
MRAKLAAVFLSIFIIIAGWLFFETNGSYQLSFKAKFYYEIGNFDEAFKLSQRALELDHYNKMASTLVNQSKIALKFTAYINEGKKYLRNIKQMSQNEVSNADRERIKLMCDIMIEGYSQLQDSPLLDSDLKNEAKNMRENFVKLKNELF